MQQLFCAAAGNVRMFVCRKCSHDVVGSNGNGSFQQLHGCFKAQVMRVGNVTDAFKCEE